MKTCSLRGEQYAEPSAISLIDNTTEIYSSCGIRQAVGELLSKPDIEELIQMNKKRYRLVNGG